jgi:hypothetical protein
MATSTQVLRRHKSERQLGRPLEKITRWWRDIDMEAMQRCGTALT